MSIISSVLGSLSPTLGSSFHDPHAHEHELPLYKSPSSSPRIPPPITSTVLWSVPGSLPPPARVPDDLLALQRRARHLEQQLQELLDAQADGLMNGINGDDFNLNDEASNGSTTPTVSSLRGQDQWDREPPRTKQVPGLNAARRGIFRRIQQLARVKEEEMEYLDEILRELQTNVERTERWSQKRSRLLGRIRDTEAESSDTRNQTLQDEASKLEQEIRLKEEELLSLKARHRRVLSELAGAENSIEAKVSSYKASLSILEKQIAGYLAKPPDPKLVTVTSSHFLKLPPKRRTLEMAHDYWQDEHARLAERCDEVDRDRAALEEGAVLWNDVMKKVVDFEASLQVQMQQSNTDPSRLLSLLETTMAYLEEKLEFARMRSWNLLVCAIGAELEAFKQGKDLLEGTLGTTRKGKEKVSDLVEAESPSRSDSGAEGSSPARGTSQPPPIKPSFAPTTKFFDTDDEDPDPELLISHQDTDTD